MIESGYKNVTKLGSGYWMPLTFLKHSCLFRGKINGKLLTRHWHKMSCTHEQLCPIMISWTRLLFSFYPVIPAQQWLTPSVAARKRRSGACCTPQQGQTLLWRNFKRPFKSRKLVTSSASETLRKWILCLFSFLTNLLCFRCVGYDNNVSCFTGGPPVSRWAAGGFCRSSTGDRKKH